MDTAGRVAWRPSATVAWRRVTSMAEAQRRRPVRALTSPGPGHRRLGRRSAPRSGFARRRQGPDDVTETDTDRTFRGDLSSSGAGRGFHLSWIKLSRRRGTERPLSREDRPVPLPYYNISCSGSFAYAHSLHRRQAPERLRRGLGPVGGVSVQRGAACTLEDAAQKTENCQNRPLRRHAVSEYRFGAIPIGPEAKLH